MRLPWILWILPIVGTANALLLDYPYPSSGGCGGIIEGNNRTLVWDSRGSEPVPTPIQCVWTIQPNGRQHVIFQVLDWDLDNQVDELTVTVGTTRTVIIDSKEPYEYSSFISRAFVVLRLRAGSPGNKFLHMSIEGRPPPWVPAYTNLPVYNWHSEEHEGQMRHPKGNPDSERYLEDEVATFVVAHPHTALEGLDILLEIDQLDVEWHHSGFNFGWTNCDMDSVDVYEILPELETICGSCANPWERVRLLGQGTLGFVGRRGAMGTM